MFSVEFEKETFYFKYYLEEIFYIVAMAIG